MGASIGKICSPAETSKEKAAAVSAATPSETEGGRSTSPPSAAQQLEASSSMMQQSAPPTGDMQHPSAPAYPQQLAVVEEASSPTQLLPVQYDEGEAAPQTMAEAVAWALGSEREPQIEEPATGQLPPLPASGAQQHPARPGGDTQHPTALAGSPQMALVPEASSSAQRSPVQLDETEATPQTGAASSSWAFGFEGEPQAEGSAAGELPTLPPTPAVMPEASSPTQQSPEATPQTVAEAASWALGLVREPQSQESAAVERQAPEEAACEEIGSSELHVTIFQATGLHHLNMVGDSIYCVCYVGKETGATSCQTKTISGSLNPIWHEHLTLKSWCKGQDLEFKIYDEGIIGSKVEGTAKLPGDYIYPHGFEGDLPIQGLPNAMLQVRVALTAKSQGPAVLQKATASTRPPRLPVRHMSPAMKLCVSIVEASGLTHLNMVGDSMYCVCQVSRSSSRAPTAKCETKQVKSLSPVWNETFDIDPWHVGEQLQFIVYDKGLIGAKKEGKAILPSEFFYPNGFDGDLPIDGLPRSLLHVRVHVGGTSAVHGATASPAPSARQLSVASGCPTPTSVTTKDVAGFHRLKVTMVRATGLKHLNLLGDSPFCVCRIPGGSKRASTTACKTKTVPRTLDPVWNETHFIEPWRAGEPLEFAVHDKGVLGSKAEGKAVVLPSHVFWPHGWEGEVAIHGIPHAKLQVRIEIAGPAVSGMPAPISSRSPRAAAFNPTVLTRPGSARALSPVAVLSGSKRLPQRTVVPMVLPVNRAEPNTPVSPTTRLAGQPTVAQHPPTPKPYTSPLLSPTIMVPSRPPSYVPPARSQGLSVSVRSVASSTVSSYVPSTVGGISYVPPPSGAAMPGGVVMHAVVYTAAPASLRVPAVTSPVLRFPSAAGPVRLW